MSPVIDLRSDTVTRPSAAMRAAMMAAPVGDDVFGDDPSVIALQEKLAAMLGFESALFVTSGTQSNLCAVLSHCQRGDEYVVGQMAHCYRWEGGGAAVFGSVQPQPLEHQSDGTIALEQIAAAIKPDDAHFARTRLLALENTLGGKLIPLDYIVQATDLAKSHGLQTHLDGARDSVRQQQRLGRHRRHLVRLYDAVGQPHRRTAGPAGHVAQPHRPQPARRAGPLSCPRFGRARAGGGRAGPPCRVKRGDSVSRRTP